MRVDIVQKKYGNTIALKDIHLNFPRGRTTLIIGTSGAGKSTLINCMTGSISFDGEISDYQPEDIAFVPQHPALNTLETAREAVYWSGLFSRRYHGSRALNQEVDKQIKNIGLQEVQHHRIDALSGGQKQRVSIAKELIRGKTILIADEIDTGLDCGVSRDLVNKLCRITHEENKTTIIISHNIVNIELYDRVIVLAKTEGRKTVAKNGRQKKEEGFGGIAFVGSPREIKRFFGVQDYVDILTRINTKSEGGYGLAERYIEETKKSPGYHQTYWAQHEE